MRPRMKAEMRRLTVARLNRKANPEERLHRAVAAYLRVALQPPAIWSTFPAGGGGRIRGAKLKAMGLARGWPDILVLYPGGHMLTLVIGIELKHGHTTSGKWRNQDGRKMPTGTKWFNPRTPDSLASSSSKSSARKLASAMIAKIPEPLARWIGRVHYPARGSAHDRDAVLACM